MVEPSLLLTVVGALASLLGTLTTYIVTRFGMRSGRRQVAAEASAETYRKRMERLSKELARASSLVDLTLQEMSTVTRARQESIRSLESRLTELTNHEKDLQTRVETLKKVSLPAVEYFLQATEKSEKRSAMRDYLLFGSGVVVSTLVTIVLKVFFGI